MIGKQPGVDTWVFNRNVQMDQNGQIIPVPEREFILECKKYDFLVNVAQGTYIYILCFGCFYKQEYVLKNDIIWILAHIVQSLNSRSFIVSYNL